jgi:hypothetical protein
VKGKTIVNEDALSAAVERTPRLRRWSLMCVSFGNKAPPADAKLVRELRDSTASWDWTAEG